MSQTADLPSWMPSPEYGVSRVPCGPYFGAVLVPRSVGELLLMAMPTRLVRGVIADTLLDALVWLVPPGSLWPGEVPGAELVPAVHLPPAAWRSRRPVRWVVAPRGDCLTDPAALSAALLAHARADAGRCAACGGVPDYPAVLTGTAADGRMVSVTSCQVHVDELTVALGYAAEVARESA
ncbi:hypothetical protein [Streptomyces harbinensis]|nr:hypothetical protein [Streptomyces harbinensis]